MRGLQKTTQRRSTRSGRCPLTGAALASLGAMAVAIATDTDRAAAQAEEVADRYLIVDCLLPGQVRRLGRNAVFQTPRRPVRTSQRDCEIRGGEYIAADRASDGGSLSWWLPLAQDGDAKAQLYVGELYEQGIGGAPDYELAALWYGRAAEQGFGPAQFNLAQLYERGQGVAANPGEATRLYRLALGAEGTQMADSIGIAEEDEEREARLAAQDAEIGRLNDQVAELNAALAAARSSSSSESDDLGAERATLDAARDALAADRATLEDERAELAARMRAEAAALSDELAEQAEDLDSREAEIQTREARLADQAEVRDVLASERAAVDAERQALAIDRATLDAERAALAARMSREAEARDTELEGLSAQLAEQTRELSSRDSDVRVMQAALEEKEALLAGQSDQIDALSSQIAALQTQLADRETQLAALRVDDGAKSRPPEPRREPSPPPRPTVRGTSYALLFAVQDYQNFDSLSTPISDVEQVAAALRDVYGYEPFIVRDATREDVFKQLDEFRELLEEDDRLIVYFAGRGAMDSGPGAEGYWLGADAQPNRRSTWIANDDVSRYLQEIRARKILVVADSVYSGTVRPPPFLDYTDAGQSPEERRMLLELQAQAVSRTALTSGALEPIAEPGSSTSVFAQAFVGVLTNVRGTMEMNDLSRLLRQNIRDLSAGSALREIPEYAPIRLAGHAAGDFVLVAAAEG